MRPAGLDFRRDERTLPAGRRLTARDIGLAAALNHAWLPVRRRPRVALLATGDELVLPGQPLARSQIVSSNTVALAAMVRQWGGEPLDLGIARDRPDSLAEASEQLRGVDLVVTMGGASVGERDLVMGVLGEHGLALDFWQIAMRPGKPLMFGRVHGVPLLGLPGNPVSVGVCAVLFVRAAICALLGLDPAPPGGARRARRAARRQRPATGLPAGERGLARRRSAGSGARSASGQLHAGHLRARRLPDQARAVRSGDPAWNRGGRASRSGLPRSESDFCSREEKLCFSTAHNAWNGPTDQI